MQSILQEALQLREQKHYQKSYELLLRLQEEHPNDEYVNFQCAWSCDVLGKEQEAVPFYEKAIQQGLEAQDLQKAYLGLGSTYRTIGEYEKSEAILRKGSELFPSNQALKVFHSLTLYNLQQHNTAMQQLLNVILTVSKDENIERYSKAIQFYKDHLDEIWK